MDDVESMVLAWGERGHVSQINGTKGQGELPKIHLRLRCRHLMLKREMLKSSEGICFGGEEILCLIFFSDDLDFYSCSWFLNFLGKVLANREIMFVMKSASQTHIS